MEKAIVKKQINLAKYTSLIGLVGLVIASAAMSPAFLKPINILNVLRQIVPNGIAACGATFVILTGGIDLSVGSLFALTGVMMSMLLPVMPWPVATLLVILMGLGLGILHGTIITKLNVPPFITTLAGITAYRGLAMLITGAANIPISNKAYTTALGSGKIPGLVVYIALGIFTLFVLYNFINQIRIKGTRLFRPLAMLVLSLLGIGYMGYLVLSVGWLSIQIVICIVILMIALFILNKTVWGRQIFAVGGNYKAAKMAGIKADNTLVKVYAFAGFCSALAGILISAKLASGVPSVGVNGEMDAISATVIGGTSLSGGAGKLSGTIIGVLLIGVLNNMLSLLNVSSDLQNISKGLIILAAVIIDTRSKKR